MHLSGVVALFLVTVSFSGVRPIPIDNGVDGEPEIECGPTAITVNFNTQKNFEGHVYVKGRYSESDCRNDQIGRRTTGISLQFSTCGVARSRSINPKGIFVTTTIVISFHPDFVTKVDRAYTLQCFYMEADKTVSTEIEVSMLTTDFQTQFVPMPVCRYEILRGGPTGEQVVYALVGEQVYHKWTCDTNHPDIFCAVVHSCYVDDGKGDTVDLLDPNGCALDRHLLANLEYPSDLMAGQEAHVFKYADRVALYFQCQITITVKEPNAECVRPTCPELQRGKRSALSSDHLNGEVTDVRYRLSVLEDLEHQLTEEEVPQSHSRRRTTGGGQSFCFALSSVVGFVASCAIVSMGIATVLLLRTKQQKKR